MTLPLTFKIKFCFRVFLHDVIILLGLIEEPNTFMKIFYHMMRTMQHNVFLSDLAIESYLRGLVSDIFLA